MQVKQWGDGNVMIVVGSAEGGVSRMRFKVPLAPGSALSEIQASLTYHVRMCRCPHVNTVEVYLYVHVHGYMYVDAFTSICALIYDYVCLCHICMCTECACVNVCGCVCRWLTWNLTLKVVT